MTTDTAALFAWEFNEGSQSDVFVATSEAEALRLYKSEYGLNDLDLEGTTIRKVPDDQEWHLYDDGDDEYGDPIERTVREHIERFGQSGQLCRNWDV